MKKPNETYLGDGLYCSFQGGDYILRAPRTDGEHWVALEPKVLRHFMDFVKATTDAQETPHDGS